MINFWQSTTLGQLCDEGSGSVQTGPFGSQLHAEDYVVDGIPFVMPTNLGENRIIEDEIARISIGDAERLSRYRLKTGDIIYGRRGDIGRRALVTQREDGWMCGSGCIRIRFGSAEVDPRFVSFYLGQNEIKEWILAKAVGSTMPNLNSEIIRSVPLRFPPLPTQRRIADILGALDDKIECNRRMNATLEEMAQLLYKHWFVDSTTGEIPEGWHESSLSELFPNAKDCAITGPFGSNLHASDYRKQGTPLILVKHVNQGKISEKDLPLVGEHKYTEMARYRLELGDIVFTRVAVVGESAYIHPRYVGWMISGQMLRVRVPDKNVLNPRYLAQVYLQKEFVAMVQNHAVGSTRPSLNTELLKTFRFLLPPTEVQNRFAEVVSAFDSQLQSNIAEIDTLTHTREYLLPKLLSGEVEVKS